MDAINHHSAPRLDGPPFAGLAEHVALALEEAILLGKLTSGERIVEADVAAELGTSNGPVREALHELETLGIVVSVPRRGTFVTRFNARLAREVFSLRALLETAALRLAMRDPRDEDRERLRRALEEMGRFPGGPSESPRQLVDSDLKLHDVLFDLGAHRLLRQSWQRLRVQARVLLVVSGALWNTDAQTARERATDIVAVHRPLVESILARDRASAERLLVEHLATGERLIIRRMAPDQADEAPLVNHILEKEEL